MSTVGKKIRDLRKRHGLTQKTLAEGIGIAQASLSALESGASKAPASENLLKISAALGVEPHVLLGHEATHVVPKLDKLRHAQAVVAVEAAISRVGKSIAPKSKAKLIAYLYESGDKVSESEALRLLELIE